MTTFGGIKFTNNQAISDFVNTNFLDFTTLVKSYSILLSETEDSLIQQKTIQESYPRIGLILASAKNTNNTFLFADPTTPSDLDLLFKNVIFLMTDVSSPFSEGIVSIAARFTASALIASLPLNSDLKNIDLAKMLEASAQRELEHITTLLKESGASTSATAAAALISTFDRQGLYVALGIDKASLPSIYFDVAPTTQEIDINSLYPNASVKSLSSLTVDPNYIPFCYYTLSTADDNLSVAPKMLQGAFFIENGATSESIIDRLSSGINELTLDFDSNILASPNRGAPVSKTVTILKQSLYPGTDIYQDKPANFYLTSRIDEVTFSARRFSVLINRELLIVYFISVAKQDITTTITSALDLLPYKNSPNTLNYVEGIIYGTVNSYTSLTKKGPHSLILDVNKGKASVTAALQSKSTSYLIDSFFFRLQSGFTSINGVLKGRLSNLTDTLPTEFSITCTNATPEEVALGLVNSLFGIKNTNSSSTTLGVLTYPHAVQIISYRYTHKETKVVVDLCIDGQVPTGLEIATGDYTGEKTDYRPKSRSISVIAIPDKFLESSKVVDNNQDYAVGKVQIESSSIGLKQARDRISIIKNRRT